MNTDPEIRKRRRLVLLGIGHTNAHVVKEWARDPIPDCDLICISNFPAATYSGMLPGTLGTQFRDEEMRIDLNALARRAGADLVMATVSGLDLPAGQILFSDREPMPFDVLSIGVGSMPAGWQQYVDSPTVIPIKPMQTFLSRLETCLQSKAETASGALRVAIVGGGVASIEIAFCLQEQYRRQNNGVEIDIEIFTSSSHVADGMTRRSVRRIERLLSQRGIGVHADSRIVDVDAHAISTENGAAYPADCVIWATGASAPVVLSKLGLETDSRGFIATTRTLQSVSDPRIFAVGDSGTILESPSPKAGVYAVRQCPVLWDNLRALMTCQPLRNFEPQHDFLKILNTGDGKALLEYGRLTVHAHWCWTLKTWIDRRFIRMFQPEIDSRSKGTKMQNILTVKSWSPYWVGAAIGVLSWFAFLTANQALGISTAFETTAAIAEQQLVPTITQTNSFFAKKSLRIDWGWMLVIGVFAGAYLSSKLSGDRNAHAVAPLWSERFGSSSLKRHAGAFVGGVLMMLGARLAGGCTSGHGISGTLQLAASSWLFVLVAFPAGILTSLLLFGQKEQTHV